MVQVVHLPIPKPIIVSRRLEYVGHALVMCLCLTLQDKPHMKLKEGWGNNPKENWDGYDYQKKGQ